MRERYEQNAKVKILPISETGTVTKCRHDDNGRPIYEVRRDSDGETHLCRTDELNHTDKRFQQIRRSGNQMRVRLRVVAFRLGVTDGNPPPAVLR